MRRLRLVSIALLVLSGPAAMTSPSAAGQKVEEDPLFAEISKVISASRYEQGIDEAPASITIVTAEEIRRFGYRTLADVLRNIRGFYVSYDRNYEYAGTRGFGRPGDYSNRFLVMVDGHTHNEKWTGGNSIGGDFGIDMDLVERIEIVRGPASALYGSSALFAVINVITKGAENLQGLNLKAMGGSFRTGGAGLTFGKTLGEEKGLILSASGLASSGQDLFYEEFDTPATNSGIAEGADGEMYGNLFGRYRVGDWTFEAKGNRRKKEIPTGSFGTLFADRGTVTTDGRSYAEARHSRITAGGAESSLRFYYDRVTYYGDYVYDYPPVTVNRDEGGARWAGAEYRWSRQAGRSHRLMAGAEYEYNLKVYQRNYDADPYFVRMDQEFRYFNYSGFVQDEIILHPKILLNVGVRRDRHQTFGQSTNPRAAFIFSPSRTTTLKALYGSAFRAPTIYELHYEDGGISIKPNPSLRPETIRTIELVWEQALWRRFSLVGSVYRYKIDDLITQITDPSDSLLQFRNVETVIANGLEAEVSGRTARGVWVSLSATQQRARDDVTDRRLTNSPERTALAGIAFPILKGRSDLGFQARYLSPRVTIDGDMTHSVYVGDLTFTSGTLWPWIDLSVGVRNLFDQQYGDPGGNEHLQDQILQDGRSYFLTLRHRF
jgi:outer membrane receptor for ferrienterochelin and colicin